MTPLRNIPRRVWRCSARAAARIVPYDSPAMNFGESQRLLRVVHRRITSPTLSRSPVNPWYVFGLPPETAREKPVETGSMKTRSVTLRRVSRLSVSPYGGAESDPTSPDTTRRGPISPRCSQTELEPGPPLKANVTGRVLSPLADATYAVMKTSALAFSPVKAPSS